MEKDDLVFIKTFLVGISVFVVSLGISIALSQFVEKQGIVKVLEACKNAGYTAIECKLYE